MNREVKVGLTVMAALLLLYLALAWVNRVHLFAPEEQSYELHFSHIAGLLEGDPVYYRGYHVGRVQRIEPQQEVVKVFVAVDKRIQLYEGAYAEIQLKELMSGKQVALYAGSGATPLASGAVIPGKASLDFSTGFSQLTDIASGLPPERILRILEQADTVMYSLKNLLAALDPQTVARSMDHIQGSTAELYQLSRQIRQQNLLGRLDSLLAGGQHFMQQAGESLAGIDRLTTQLQGAHIDSLLLHLDQMALQGQVLMQEVDSLLQQARQQQSLAGKILLDPAFAQQIDSTLYYFDVVLKQIRNEKLYISLGKNKKR
ncbi:MAG: MCE family protein [Bacteroidetes bacterium]|nr:MAG: MCE family protein [Bacteroidota bacterium]